MISRVLILSLLTVMNPVHVLANQRIDKTEEVAASGKALYSVSDKEILEIFFRTFFEKSQGGYVLYGSKPICAEGVLPKETSLFMLGDDQHKSNIIFKEGYKIWNKIPCENQKYFVHLCEKLSYGWQHLLLINREEFIKVVKENLPLFQYVLGPDVSPEKLFEKLMDPEESFASIFQDNKVLIGIVLGFGTQNALHVSREENIGDSLAKPEKLPYRSLIDRSKEAKKRGENNWKTKEVAPGFGHSSLEEELGHLNETIFVSKDLVDKTPLVIPWFGCLKNRETQQLLKGYTKTRSKIHDLIKDDRFLEKVLVRFLEKDVTKVVSDLSSIRRTARFGEFGGSSSGPAVMDRDAGCVPDTPKERSIADGLLEWPSKFTKPGGASYTHRDSAFIGGLSPSSVIAQAINEGLPEHDEEWVASFIDGMQSHQKGEPLLPSHQWYDLLGSYQESKKALEAKQNLMESEQFFSDLSRRKDLIALVPGKLFYKVLKAGKGQAIETIYSVVEMGYVIKDHSGAVRSATQASDKDSIDLSTLIVGLSSGMKGMVIGEKREIYIHPCLAYGETSNFSPNTGLVIEVTLQGIDVQEREKKELSLIHLELLAADANESEVNKTFQSLRRQVASQLGARTWNHFRKGQKAGYSLSAITQALIQESKNEASHELSPEADDWLNQVHWRIYHPTD